MIKILEPSLNGNEKKYVLKCIEDNWISSQGEFVTQFESVVLRGNVDRRALATSNGTTALHLALVALGVGVGDEVLVPEITFGATLNAVYLTGALPVIVDIDPDDWNISRERLDDAITSKTKAIIPVMLLGNPTGIATVCEWASGRKILTVVDAAEAVGAKINGEDIGGFGDAVIYSYFGNKTITTGEGGAVVFKNEEVSCKARVLRDHGMTPGRRYHHELIGFNYRMTNIQAAIGVAQYEQLDQILEKKSKISSLYQEYLHASNIRFQRCDPSSLSSNWIFGALLPQGSMRSVKISLEAESIEYRPCFEPMSIQPAFKSSKVSGSLDCSRELSENLVLLPSHVNLTDLDVLRVSRAVLRGIGNYA